jgi:hypothetical protein
VFCNESFNYIRLLEPILGDSPVIGIMHTLYAVHVISVHTDFKYSDSACIAAQYIEQVHSYMLYVYGLWISIGLPRDLYVPTHYLYAQ